ncbi:MAG: sigma-70 family RNA polymerase sigma factor [Planctomycetes bacterium]|nr:sigma-70 family RNA polymerase sigma factor [Planctomycetota bacterium]
MSEPPGSVTGPLNNEDPSPDQVAYIYIRLMPLLVQILVWKGWEQQVADEAAHATLTKLLLEVDNLPRPFKDRQAFLWFCVTTALRDLWRSDKRYREADGMPIDAEPKIASTVSEVIRREDYEEMRRMLKFLLESLTDVQLQIFFMRLEQKSVGAIATQTGLTKGQVEQELEELRELCPGLSVLNPRGRKPTTPELGPGTFIQGVIRAILDGQVNN